MKGEKIYEAINSTFLHDIKMKILNLKQAFLLHHLLADFRVLCTDHCIPEDTYFQTTMSLRRFLHQHFEEELSVYPSGKYCYPCEYSLATL